MPGVNDVTRAAPAVMPGPRRLYLHRGYGGFSQPRQLAAVLDDGEGQGGLYVCSPFAHNDVLNCRSWEI